MAERAELLAAIRRRTRSFRPAAAPDSAWSPRRDVAPPPSVADPIDRFTQELQALGGHVRRVADDDQARDHIVSLARAREARRVLRWDVPELERLGLEEPLRACGAEVIPWRGLDDFRAVAADAEVGVSLADWAVADTGSVILSHGPARGRSAVLLPPTHVTLLEAGRIVPTIFDAYERLAELDELPPNIAFHTGPSRSGDLEQIPVVGVHGPGDVHVVVLG